MRLVFDFISVFEIGFIVKGTFGQGTQKFSFAIIPFATQNDLFQTVLTHSHIHFL